MATLPLARSRIPPATQAKMPRTAIYGLLSNFPGLPLFKKLAADKHVIADLPLVRFVIINLTR